ncbi:hypothetical protein [Gottfriedia acidiceleris]|uniref:hypothetical protein n=1 Tax=Gottfriedia acidiceleris TaxID=371036 RepID=UPI002FFFFB7A
MEKYEGPLDLNKIIWVSVDYQDTNLGKVNKNIRELVIKNDENEVLFQKIWTEEQESGTSFSLDRTRLYKGQFKVGLYKNDKVIKKKIIILSNSKGKFYKENADFRILLFLHLQKMDTRLKTSL